MLFLTTSVRQYSYNPIGLKLYFIIYQIDKDQFHDGIKIARRLLAGDFTVND